jgi:hypothetical protein
MISAAEEKFGEEAPRVKLRRKIRKPFGRRRK